MKLIIQIPCYNESESLPALLKELPRNVAGFDEVEWLVIDDGSTDNTVDVARSYGVDHFVHFAKNQGLARGFMAGLSACLELGADVIVNTDADNQYNSEDIPKLTEPIISGRADIVIGARPIQDIEHFSLLKKMLQRIGSWSVKIASNSDVPDAPSGFRAISREAALRINVFNNYTYTLETIIQAGRKNMSVMSVPVRVNEQLRPSRLVKSLLSYVNKSIVIIFRIFAVYKPVTFFFSLGSIFFFSGFLLGVRWLVLFFIFHTTRTHVPSLILTAILIIMGFLIYVLGILADLISANRKILEENQYMLRKMMFETDKGHGKK